MLLPKGPGYQAWIHIAAYPANNKAVQTSSTKASVEDLKRVIRIIHLCDYSAGGVAKPETKECARLEEVVGVSGNLAPTN
jgi:hypothetical protein